MLDHGVPRLTIEEDLDGARGILAALREAGVDLTRVTDKLEQDGVAAFKKSFDDLSRQSRGKEIRVRRHGTITMTQTVLEPNPLQESIRLEKIPEPCVMVIFGASGDLTRRKLIPAIFDLEAAGVASRAVSPLWGSAGRRWTTTRSAPTCTRRCRSRDISTTRRASLWDEFAKTLHYVAVDAKHCGRVPPATRATSHHRCTEHIAQSNYLFYLATPPSMYAPIIRHIGVSGLNRPAAG